MPRGHRHYYIMVWHMDRFRWRDTYTNLNDAIAHAKTLIPRWSVRVENLTGERTYFEYLSPTSHKEPTS